MATPIAKGEHVLGVEHIQSATPDKPSRAIAAAGSHPPLPAPLTCGRLARPDLTILPMRALHALTPPTSYAQIPDGEWEDSHSPSAHRYGVTSP